jgi:hypothetical protein
MGTGSFPGVKRPGRGVDHPPQSSAEVKERVELYPAPPLDLRGLFYGKFYFTILILYRSKKWSVLWYVTVQVKNVCEELAKEPLF